MCSGEHRVSRFWTQDHVGRAGRRRRIAASRLRRLLVGILRLELDLHVPRSSAGDDRRILQRRLVHRQTVLAPGGPHVDEHRLLLARGRREPFVSERCQPAFTFSSTLDVTADASTNRFGEQPVRFVAVVEPPSRESSTPNTCLTRTIQAPGFGSAARPAPAIGHGTAMPTPSRNGSASAIVVPFAYRLLENSTT